MKNDFNHKKRKIQNPLPDIAYAVSRLGRKTLPADFRGRGAYAYAIRHVKREKYVCIITMDGFSPSTRRAMRGIERVLAANGYNAVYRDSQNLQSKEEKILKSMMQRKIVGYIIEPSKSQLMCGHMYIYNRLDKENIPYVFIRAAYPQMTDKPSVTVDDNKGGYILTRHMIATAGENVVGIFRADSSRGVERHKGYVRALQEAGIPYRPELVIWYHIEEQTQKPILAIEGILNMHPCDGIICYDDVMAEDVIDYLTASGYAVPDDIAVAGYGNAIIATNGRLGLTTVAQPDELMGEMAAEYLIEKMTKGFDGVTEKVLNPELVIRGSTIGSDI